MSNGTLTPSASSHLDLLRGGAALIVVAGHVRGLFLADWATLPGAARTIPWMLFYGVTSLGHQAVMVFFVLSGFLVGGSVVRSLASGRWSLVEYAAARLARLYVVVLPALALTAAADAVALSLPEGARWLALPIPHFGALPAVARTSATTLAGNLVFLQTIAVEPFGSNAALWSLTNEFWYYVAFPPLAVALLARSRRLWPLHALAAAALWLVLPAFLLSGFAIWLLGVAVYQFHAGRAPATRAWLLLPGGAVWLGALLAVMTGKLHDTAADMVGGVAFALFLAALLRATAGQSQPAQWYSAIARTLSGFSFSLYAIHLPLAILLRVWVGGPALQPGARAVATTALVVAGTALCAWLFSTATEAHTASVRRRLSSAARRLLGAATPQVA